MNAVRWSVAAGVVATGALLAAVGLSLEARAPSPAAKDVAPDVAVGTYDANASDWLLAEARISGLEGCEGETVGVELRDGGDTALSSPCHAVVGDGRVGIDLAGERIRVEPVDRMRVGLPAGAAAALGGDGTVEGDRPAGNDAGERDGQASGDHDRGDATVGEGRGDPPATGPRLGGPSLAVTAGHVAAAAALSVALTTAGAMLLRAAHRHSTATWPTRPAAPARSYQKGLAFSAAALVAAGVTGAAAFDLGGFVVAEQDLIACSDDVDVSFEIGWAEDGTEPEVSAVTLRADDGGGPDAPCVAEPVRVQLLDGGGQPLAAEAAGQLAAGPTGSRTVIAVPTGHAGLRPPVAELGGVAVLVGR